LEVVCRIDLEAIICEEARCRLFVQPARLPSDQQLAEEIGVEWRENYPLVG
jgi:hypothetical protein